MTHYFNARYYDPVIGRFSSADDAQPGLGDPLGLDNYGYVGGQVETATDPSGQLTTDGCDGECVAATRDLAEILGGTALGEADLVALPVVIFGVLVYEVTQETAPYANDRDGLLGYNHGRYVEPDSSYLQARTRAKRAEEQKIAQETLGWGPPDTLNQFRPKHAPVSTSTPKPPPPPHPTGQPA